MTIREQINQLRRLERKYGKDARLVQPAQGYAYDGINHVEDFGVYAEDAEEIKIYGSSGDWYHTAVEVYPNAD